MSNVNIVSAEPPGIFNRAAKDAVKQWQYKQPSVKLSGLLVQLDFVVDKDPANKRMLENDEADPERIAVVRH